MTSEKEKKLQKIIDQRIEEKKKEIKKEAKKEVREELKEEIADNVDDKAQTEDMSRRQFLKKAGLGAASLGAVSLSPAAANLKLTKSGIFGSSTKTQKIQDLETVSFGDLETGRTWQDVTSSRSFDTQETNNTDSEIKVIAIISVEADGTAVGLDMYVDGSRVDKVDDTFNTNNNATVQAVAVPPGSTYELNTYTDTSNFSLNNWREFRP